MRSRRFVSTISALMVFLVFCLNVVPALVPLANADPGDGDMWVGDWLGQELSCMPIEFLGILLSFLGIKNPWL